MNQFRKPSEESTKEDKALRKQSALASLIFSVFDGSFLNAAGKKSNLPFAVFVTLVVCFYIANTYSAERTIRETDKINNQLKEFRDEYISLKSELMFRSNQSQVAIKAAPLGLKEANEPPHKLFINNPDSSKTQD